MNKKNHEQTISKKFVEKQDNISIAPIVLVKYEKNKLNEKSSLKQPPHLSKETKTTKKTISQPKERITVQINQNIIERVKDCVYWNRLTVAKFVEEALEVALKAAEIENGNPFQKRRSELKPGRPTK